MPDQRNSDQVIYGARQGFVAFADTVIDSTRFIADASPADADRTHREAALSQSAPSVAGTI